MRTTQLNKIPDQYRDLHTEAGASEPIDELARLYLGVAKYPYHQDGDVRVVFRIAPRRVATMETTMPDFGTST